MAMSGKGVSGAWPFIILSHDDCFTCAGFVGLDGCFFPISDMDLSPCLQATKKSDCSSRGIGPKGTSLRVVKKVIPFLLAFAVFMYLSRDIYNSEPSITFIVQLLSYLLFTPWFYQALCDYLVEVHFGFLDSGD